MPVAAKALKCRICESQLKAKNDSLNDLQVRYNNQTLVLANLTTYYNLCEGSKVSLSASLAAAGETVETLKGKIEDLERQVGNEHEAYQKRVKGLRDIIKRMQRHLLCMQTEEQCQDESEHYTCLPKDILTLAFVTVDVEGQELFGIPTSHFLGDLTWKDLDWQQFKKENPNTYMALLVLITLASIGATGLLLLLISLLVYYRWPICAGFRRLRSLCTRGPASPILKKTDPGTPSTDQKTPAKSDQDPEASTSAGTGGSPDPTTSTPGAAKKHDFNAAWKKGKDGEDPTVKLNKA